MNQLQSHIADCFKQWDINIKLNYQAKPRDANVVLRNAKSEQIIDDLMSLYLAIRYACPEDATFLYLELQKRMPIIAGCNPIFLQESHRNQVNKILTPQPHLQS